MFVQIFNNKIDSYSKKIFDGYTKEYPNIDYDDYNNNPNKYILDNNLDLILNPNYDSYLLEKAKKNKLTENQTKRDSRLVAGILYKNVLFDSDTDQKINILAKVSSMSDTDTQNWRGKDGVSYANCTKLELLELGGLIEELTTRIWDELNPNYINQINACLTVEEVNAIEINY